MQFARLYCTDFLKRTVSYRRYCTQAYTWHFNLVGMLCIVLAYSTVLADFGILSRSKFTVGVI